MKIREKKKRMERSLKKNRKSKSGNQYKNKKIGKK